MAKLSEQLKSFHQKRKTTTNTTTTMNKEKRTNKEQKTKQNAKHKTQNTKQSLLLLFSPMRQLPPVPTTTHAQSTQHTAQHNTTRSLVAGYWLLVTSN